jgi:undecaprenyl-diphosphatase
VDDRGAGPPHQAAAGVVADHSRTGRANAGDLVIALLGLAGFALLTVVVAARIVVPFDQPLLAIARTWDGWPLVWEALSQSANIPLIVIGLALVVWLFWTKRRREALVVLLMLAAVTAGSEGVKQLVGRPRPSGTGDGIPGVVYSYPSGHVLEALTILGIVALRSWRSSRPFRLGLAVVVLVMIEVILVGIARLALNAHYPSDVLGGLLGGIGVLGLYAWLTRSGAWADQPTAGSRDGPRGLERPGDAPRRSPGETP